MARDQTRPMTDEDIQTLREDIEEVRKEVRKDLAADFGGDPEDYRVGNSISVVSERFLDFVEGCKMKR